MKIVIEIPEKTIAHIRSDYGHGVKGLRDKDREIVCDANAPQHDWKCGYPKRGVEK